MSAIKAPSHLCLYSNQHRQQTLSFLNSIEEQGFFFGNNVVVDLTATEHLTAAASTLMFAIVNRVQLLRKDANSVRFRFPVLKNNPSGHKWIVGTGLSKALLAGSETRLENLVKNKEYYQSAVLPHVHYPLTVDLLDSQANLSFLQFNDLSTAISEAMLNVLHHAYDFEELNATTEAMGGKRWWQCAWFDPEKDAVVFIICDLGLGILTSYLSGNEEDRNLQSTEVIKRAFSRGGTRYGKGSERGNGSEDMKMPIGVSAEEEETLLVFSGRNYYRYSSNEKDATCVVIPELVTGTLIQWSLVRNRSGHE